MMTYDEIVNWLNCRKYHLFAGAVLNDSGISIILEDTSGFSETIDIPVESLTVIKRGRKTIELSEAEKAGDA